MKIKELLNENITTLSDASFEKRLERLMEKIHDNDSRYDLSYDRVVVSMLKEFFTTVFKMPAEAVDILRSDGILDFFRTPEHIEDTLTNIHNFIKKYGPNCFSPSITLAVEKSTNVKIVQNKFDYRFLSRCAGEGLAQQTDMSPWQWLDMLAHDEGDQFNVKTWEQAEKSKVDHVFQFIKHNPNSVCFEWIHTEEKGDYDRNRYYCYSVINP